MTGAPRGSGTGGLGRAGHAGVGPAADGVRRLRAAVCGGSSGVRGLSHGSSGPPGRRRRRRHVRPGGAAAGGGAPSSGGLAHGDGAGDRVRGSGGGSSPPPPVRGALGGRDLDPRAAPACDGARQRRHRQDPRRGGSPQRGGPVGLPGRSEPQTAKGVKVVVSDGSVSYAAATAKRLGHARRVPGPIPRRQMARGRAHRGATRRPAPPAGLKTRVRPRCVPGTVRAHQTPRHPRRHRARTPQWPVHRSSSAQDSLGHAQRAAPAPPRQRPRRRPRNPPPVRRHPQQRPHTRAQQHRRHLPRTAHPDPRPAPHQTAQQRTHRRHQQPPPESCDAKPTAPPTTPTPKPATSSSPNLTPATPIPQKREGSDFSEPVRALVDATISVIGEAIKRTVISGSSLRPLAAAV